MLKLGFYPLFGSVVGVAVCAVQLMGLTAELVGYR